MSQYLEIILERHHENGTPLSLLEVALKVLVERISFFSAKVGVEALEDQTRKTFWE